MHNPTHFNGSGNFLKWEHRHQLNIDTSLLPRTVVSFLTFLNAEKRLYFRYKLTNRNPNTQNNGDTVVLSKQLKRKIQLMN